MYTPEIARFTARKIKPYANFSCDSNLGDLPKLGMGFSPRVEQLIFNAAMDAIQPDITTPSITVPIQFLQNWLPGFVKALTAARKIDSLVGMSTIGSWEMEEIVQGIIEPQGTAVPYGDYSNVPFGTWNTNWNRRTIVRFEEGLRVTILAAARAAIMNVDDSAIKRDNALLQLEIQRNAVGFYGFNNGANFTYGFLNDPNLPAYVTVPNGANGFSQWSKKTYLEIVADIRVAVSALRNQSLDRVDVSTTPLTLALPTAVVDFLTVSTDFGYSVRKWMNETYPNIRVESAPELNGANGGANVGYLYADEINDSGTDDNRTWIQVVPNKFFVLGVAQLTKHYEESFSNATAGLMLKRPLGVYRMSGI